jgi:hypothetical protein
MGEKIRTTANKWKNVIIVLGVYGTLIGFLLQNSRTLGEVTATNNFLMEGKKENAANIKGIDSKVDTMSIVMTKVVATLDNLEKRQTISEQRLTDAEQNRATTDIEIIRLLKINNLQPYKWKDISILPDLKRK